MLNANLMICSCIRVTFK